jgi:MFS family permease
MYAWLLCGVLFLVNVWDFSTLQAGLLVSPGAVLSAVAAIGVGRLAGKISPRAAMLVGLVLITAVGAWLSINLPQERHLWDLWFPSVVFSGIGMGMVSTGVSQAAATSVLPQKFAGGIGLTMAARQVGGALGIAVLAAILTGQAAGASRPYEQILLFCTVTAALAGLAAFAIRPRVPASAI